MSLPVSHLFRALTRLREVPARSLPRHLRSCACRYLKHRRLSSLLCDYYRREYSAGERNVIRGLRCITGGWECEMYAFSVESGLPGRRSSEELILRLYPGAFAEARAALEYETMIALGAAGYPVPRVDHHGCGGSVFSTPFLIKEYIDGRTLWQPMFDSAPETRAEMRRVFCSLLARLHSLDWRKLVRDPGQYEPAGPYSTVEALFAHIETRLGQALLPGFRSGWQWLQTHRRDVVCHEPSMVHLDFHPDNVLLRRGVDPAAGGAIVIDWTSATVTDYRFGLASALVVIGAFQDWDESQAVLEDYQRQSGEAVENLEVFEAAACFLRLVLMTNSLMGDGQRIGMRSGIERMLRAQMPAMRRLYERFLRLTGIVIPEVEKLAHQGRFCASMGTTPGSTLLSRNSALHAASR